MNTYALAGAANEGVRLHGASTGWRAMAQACPPSSRSRADRCRPAAANSFASCRDGQRPLWPGNASRPVGNVFRLRRPTPSTAMVFGRAAENFIGRSPAPKVFASNVFFLDARCGTPRSKGGAESGASTAGKQRGTNQNWYGVADCSPFMACPGASKVAKSKLRFPRKP